MKYFRLACLSFLVCALIDNVCSDLFCIDYTYSSLSFVGHFALVFLMMYAIDLTWKDRLIVGAFAGIITDLFFTQTFPYHFLVYPLFCVALTIFDGRLHSRKVSFVLIFSAVLLVDFLPYTIGFFLNAASVPYIHEWFLYLELGTLLMNICAIFALQTYWSEARKLSDARQERILKNSIHV